MACAVSLGFEVEPRDITAASVSSLSSSTLTSDASHHGGSRIARALRLLLSEREGITHCPPNDFPATLKPARRSASTEDILASDITKHALRLRATEYWQAASSLDALNRHIARENSESKKTATTYAAVQLWRSIVINLEQNLRAKHNSRLSLRRMLCLHPQYSGSQILDCVLEYLTAAVGRHMLVDKRHGRLVCLKLLKSGVIENAKDSSCSLFNEASMYRFTGRQVSKVSTIYSIGAISVLSDFRLKRE